MITWQCAAKNILLAVGMVIVGYGSHAVGTIIINYTLWERPFSAEAATSYGMAIATGFVIGRWWSWMDERDRLKEMKR